MSGIEASSAPGTGSFGLAWDGTNLWLADRDTDLYQLTTTGTVLSSFASWKDARRSFAAGSGVI